MDDFLPIKGSRGVEVKAKDNSIIIEKDGKIEEIGDIKDKRRRRKLSEAKTAHGLILGLNQKFSREAKYKVMPSYSAKELEILFTEKVKQLNIFNKMSEQELSEWDRKLPLLNKMDVEKSKVDILNNLDKGMRCPACNQYVKRYKRKLNSGMAYCLINIYKMIPDMNYEDGWFHINEVLKRRRINPTNLEMQKLRFWGFVEQKMHDNDPTKKHSGYWRLTEKGKNFVEGKVKVPKHIFLFNAEFLGTSEEETSIKEALGDKFNYEELLKA